MRLRIAFAGFRHGHIFGLYHLLRQRADIEIVAVCEEDAGTRGDLTDAGIAVSHESYDDMLETVSCDAVACGDYFGIRGARVLRALETGRNVLCDKPICTSLQELDAIELLVAKTRLCLGAMLDLCDLGPFLTLRGIIRAGQIGEVHTVTFLGQHPLLYGKRPRWYYEPGKHGGTINDLAIHGIDSIPWLTGRRVVEVTAARGWNAGLPQHPEFQNGAVLMLRLDNDGAVLGDVSYLASDRHGYQMAPYWRYTISGSGGVAETACNDPHVTVWRHDTEEILREPVAPNRVGGFFDDFLADLAGSPNADGLETRRVLESSRLALEAQDAADSRRFPRPVGADMSGLVSA